MVLDGQGEAGGIPAPAHGRDVDLGHRTADEDVEVVPALGDVGLGLVDRVTQVVADRGLRDVLDLTLDHLPRETRQLAVPDGAGEKDDHASGGHPGDELLARHHEHALGHELFLEALVGASFGCLELVRRLVVACLHADPERAARSRDTAGSSRSAPR
jgi:hypothetical protein